MGTPAIPQVAERFPAAFQGRCGSLAPTENRGMACNMATLRYCGLGKHANMVFISQVRRESGVPYLCVKSDSGSNTAQEMLSVERGRAIFSAMLKGT